MEQQELQVRLLFRHSALRFLSTPVSILLTLSGLGHLFTQVGRKHWKIVIRKYILFTFVSLGIWTQEAYEAYEVEELLKYFSYKDPEEVSINLIPLIVASLAILLQVLGGSTALISIVIINLCSSPLFVFSKEMVESIPPLLHLNPRESAIKKERTEQLGLYREEDSDRQTHVEEWVINIWAASIFLTESRLIVFLANLVSLVMAIIMLKDVSISSFYLALLMLCIVPYFIGVTLIPVMYVGKRLNLTDEDFTIANLGWLLQLFTIWTEIHPAEVHQGGILGGLQGERMSKDLIDFVDDEENSSIISVSIDSDDFLDFESQSSNDSISNSVNISSLGSISIYDQQEELAAEE